MGYRITYGSERKESVFRRITLTLIFFLMFLLLVNLFWPEAIPEIKQAFHKLQKATAVAALEGFAEELNRGADLSEAFATFCQNMKWVADNGSD